MTPEQFVFWLRGYLAAEGVAGLPREAVKRISETLAAVPSQPAPAPRLRRATDFPAIPEVESVPLRPGAWPTERAPVELPATPWLPPFTVTCATPNTVKP